MHCRSVKRWIPRLLDGELVPAQAERLATHLAQCGTCRAELDALRQTMTALGAWPGLESAFTFSDIKVRAAMRQTRRGWLPDSASFRKAPRWTAAVGVAVAILAGTAAGIGLEGARSACMPHPESSSLVADVLSLGSADDPLADLAVAGAPRSSTESGSDRKESSR